LVKFSLTAGGTHSLGMNTWTDDYKTWQRETRNIAVCYRAKHILISWTV